MAVKITVLSGSLQGRVLETNKNVIRVGADKNSELPFDALSDPEIEGQQVRFELLDDRWRLFNASAQPLFVNQDLVRDATGLRSGDLIRLSQDGPDVLFEINQNSSASIEPNTLASHSGHPTQHSDQSIPASTAIENTNEQTRTPVPVKAVEAVPTATDHKEPIHNSTASESMASDSMASEPMTAISPNDAGKKKSVLPVARRKSTKRRGSKLATLITLVAVPTGGIAGISIAVVLLWVVWKKDPLGIMQPPPATQQTDVDPNETAPQGNQAAPLAGAKLPAAIVPSETNVSDRSQLPANTAQVPTTPPPPDDLSIKPFELKILDLSATPSLVVDLSKNIINTSESAVYYQRDPQTQQGVAIDPLSGFLTWSVPSELAGQEIQVPFLVSLGNPAVTTKRGFLRLQITSAKPERASNHEAMKSIYLLATKTSPGERYLPLGTACSIGKNTLLTSASVATGLFDVQKRGWQIVAFQTPSGTVPPLVMHEITEVKAHKIFLDASQRKDQEGRMLQEAYFDLAILKTPTDMESSLVMSPTIKEQIDVESFTCIGYPINGKAIPDLSKLLPLQENVRLIARIPPPKADVIKAKPPLLLQFEGTMLTNIFGGIFLNAKSEVVGIYTFSAPLPAETESPNVCYASESLPALGLLDDIDRNKDFWMSASEHADTQ